jgi:hypothetical protein
MVVDVEICRLGGGEVRRLSLGEALPDHATIKGGVDESLFTDLIPVGEPFTLTLFRLVTCCNVSPVIGWKRRTHRTEGVRFLLLLQVRFSSAFCILMSSALSASVATRWHSC